jgi:multidrug efflux pump subunit AcrA (membrane-fusion protein)
MKALFLVVLFAAQLLQAAPEKPKAVQVQIEKAQAKTLFTLLTYPARLHPKVNATVLSETEGVVTEIKAPLGTAVEKGSKLLVIKNTDPIYSYAPLTLTSPVKGAVSSLDVSVGSRITRGQKIGTITDPSQVLITVEIAASDIFSIQKGLEGTLRLPGMEQPIPLVVRGVSPFVDPGTGTATAELVLKNSAPKASLPPGSVGQVSFRAQEHQGIEVPESAVVYKGKAPHLRILEGNKAKYVPVTLGVTRQGLVEVLKGLSDGMAVVVRASQYVGDGEEVTVESEEKKG